MKITLAGGFGLIGLGILLYFLGVATPWVVFSVSLGVGLILITTDNSIVLRIGIALLIVAGIAFVIALSATDRQLLPLWP